MPLEATAFCAAYKQFFAYVLPRLHTAAHFLAQQKPIKEILPESRTASGENFYFTFVIFRME